MTPICFLQCKKFQLRNLVQPVIDRAEIGTRPVNSSFPENKVGDLDFVIVLSILNLAVPANFFCLDLPESASVLIRSFLYVLSKSGGALHDDAACPSWKPSVPCEKSSRAPR